MIATSTILTTAAVVAIVGAGLSAYGMYEQGQAQQAVSRYNEAIYKNNATAVRQQSELEADRIWDRGRRILGAQKAAASKSGLTISGSVNDVIYDSAINIELDALTSVYQGYITSAGQVGSARLSRFEGDTAATLGTIGAGGSLLSGLAQAGAYAGAARQPASTNNYPTIE